MIVEVLFAILVTLFQGLTFFLPDWEPIDIAGYVTGLDLPNMPGLVMLDHFVPVQLLLALVGIMLTMYAASLAYTFVVYVLTKVHVLGGSSDE